MPETHPIAEQSAAEQSGEHPETLKEQDSLAVINDMVGDTEVSQKFLDPGPPRQNETFAQIGSRKFFPQHAPKLLQEMHGLSSKMPKLQHDFDKEDQDAKATRVERQKAVLEAFKHAWSGYKDYAWMHDEVRPVTQKSSDPFGGWAATLVDSLDTLWIMGLRDEFEEAVNASKDIDFSDSVLNRISVFETTIRYLGGFLGAYDISDGKYPILLEKAKEVGEFLYCAFDTPNHMPVTMWPWKQALEGGDQYGRTNTILADIGSLTLEFTRLSQLTGDMRFFDAVTRIMGEMQRVQSQTRIPGLWPYNINANDLTFNDTSFTLGALADSMYEYLPKQHLLLGGRSDLIRYDTMYKFAITAIMNHLIFQPMLPDENDILFAASANVVSSPGEEVRTKILPGVQHLACFAGAMVGMGAKLFSQPEQMNMARKLTDGCVWAYQAMPSGVMPEGLNLIPCDMNSDCKWNETFWDEYIQMKIELYPEAYKPLHVDNETDSEEGSEPKLPSTEDYLRINRLPKGVPEITDRRYLLRPEAIESVFVHYRLSGDKDLPDKAWEMFSAVDKAARTEIAHSALQDVTAKAEMDTSQNGENPGSRYGHTDNMESFWLAETLKYYYLIFSEPDVMDLDEFVLNTEAHPFRRPKPGNPVVEWTRDGAKGEKTDKDQEQAEKDVKAEAVKKEVKE